MTELLGRGGMGEVWRAFDTATEREVAVKVLPAQFVNDELFQQRFRREARSAAGLNEPHVIPIFDYGDVGGRLFVAMRLIEGEDLQAVIDRGPLSAVRAVGIIEQIASALNAAHRIDLVHRDVKPSNILIAEDDFAYLIDFGIARAAGETGLTSTGATIGTWAYMAPERFEHGTADARVDVYALTCVLHQALTGQLPFPGQSLEQIAMAHMLKPPPQPSTLKAQVPQQMDAVIATGMAKDPAQRYPTTKDLATAARRALKTPSTVMPPNPSRATDDRDRTRPAPVRRLDQLPPPVPHQPSSPLTDTASTPSWRQRQTPPVKVFLITAIALIVTFLAASFVTGFLYSPASPTQAALPSTISQSTISQTLAPLPPVNLVTADDLPGLLLTPDQISTAMGTIGMVVTGPASPTGMYNPPTVSDLACQFMTTPAINSIYGSASSAARVQELGDPNVTARTSVHTVIQAVVQFSTASDASAFFTTSAQQWSACANRQYTEPNAGLPDDTQTVGPLSNDNGTLSATRTISGGTSTRSWDWQSCQRALTVANNVIVDILTCSKNRADAQSDSAVVIAQQIAARVPR